MRPTLATTARLALSFAACAALGGCARSGATEATSDISPGEWAVTGGDPGGMKYSPLAIINRENVDQLELAWSWATGEKEIDATDSTKAARPGSFEATPIMINDTLFLSTPYNRVVALDAATGRELWSFDPGPTPLASHRTAPVSFIAASRAGVTGRSEGSSSTAAGASSRSMPLRESRSPASVMAER